MNYYVCTQRVSPKYPRSSFQHKGDLCASKGQRTRDMRQQGIGDKAEGEQNQGEGNGVFIFGRPARSRTTSGLRQNTQAIMQRHVIEVKFKPCVRMRYLILIGVDNYISQKRLLIARLESSALVVILQKGNYPNKGRDLGATFRNVI